MKKFTGFLGLTLVIAVFISACTKKPDAGFTASKGSPLKGETVQFTNTSSDASSYKWDFGDGTNSTVTSPAHIYNTAGSYTAKLTAYSKKERKSSIATLTINVIQTTDLDLYVYLNGTTTAVASCEMGLYTSQTDWDNLTNVVVSGNTNANGRITFCNLQPIVYYIDAYKAASPGYYANWDLGYITDALTINTINAYNIYVQYYSSKSGEKKYKVVGITPKFLDKIN